ncbi:MAG: hypothetical protein QM490_04130 [Candidatus Gracilibacteria bacterium]
MAPEQNNNLSGQESMEKAPITIDNIKQDIENNLSSLSEIDADNETISKMIKITEHYREDKEALLVISKGLEKIVHEVNSIKAQGKEKIGKIIKTMMAGIEKSEYLKDINDLEELNNI